MYARPNPNDRQEKLVESLGYSLMMGLPVTSVGQHVKITPCTVSVADPVFPFERGYNPETPSNFPYHSKLVLIR